MIGRKGEPDIKKKDSQSMSQNLTHVGWNTAFGAHVNEKFIQWCHPSIPMWA